MGAECQGSWTGYECGRLQQFQSLLMETTKSVSFWGLSRSQTQGLERGRAFLEASWEQRRESWRVYTFVFWPFGRRRSLNKGCKIVDEVHGLLYNY